MDAAVKVFYKQVLADDTLCQVTSRTYGASGTPAALEKRPATAPALCDCVSISGVHFAESFIYGSAGTRVLYPCCEWR